MHRYKISDATLEDHDVLVALRQEAFGARPYGKAEQVIGEDEYSESLKHWLTRCKKCKCACILWHVSSEGYETAIGYSLMLPLSNDGFNLLKDGERSEFDLRGVELHDGRDVRYIHVFGYYLKPKYRESLATRALHLMLARNVAFFCGRRGLKPKIICGTPLKIENLREFKSLYKIEGTTKDCLPLISINCGQKTGNRRLKIWLSEVDQEIKKLNDEDKRKKPLFQSQHPKRKATKTSRQTGGKPSNTALRRALRLLLPRR